MACEKHLHSNLGNQPLKLLKWFATPLGENLLYLTKRAKSRGKDLKPEILIRKTTIVRGHRKSSMTVSLREIDRRKSFIRRIGGKKVSKLAISIRLKQLDLILHLIYVIKSLKKRTYLSIWYVYSLFSFSFFPNNLSIFADVRFCLLRIRAK